MEIDNGFSLENFEKDIQNIQALADSWEDLSVEDLQINICLALEFYCAAHGGLDIVEVVNKIRECVIDVNDALGPFRYYDGEEWE